MTGDTRRTRRTALPGWAWALLTWLVVVAAASTFGWLAISRAGERVLALPVAPLPADEAQGGRTADTGRLAAVSGNEPTPGSGGSPTGEGPAGATVGAPAGTDPAATGGGTAAPSGVRPGQVLSDPVPPSAPAPQASPDAAGAGGQRTAGSSPPTTGTSGQGQGQGRPEAPPARAAAPAPPANSNAPVAAAPAGPQPVDASEVVNGGQVRVTCTGDAIQLNGATPSNGWAMQTDVKGTREVRVEFRSDAGKSEVRAQCASGVPVFEVDDAEE